jgi:hypothetical protein
MPGNAAVDAGETVKAATAGVEPAAAHMRSTAGVETTTAAMEPTTAAMEPTTAAAVEATASAMSAAATPSRSCIGGQAHGANGDACKQRKSDFGRFGGGTTWHGNAPSAPH